MKLYSTNNHKNIVSLKEAVLSAFPADRGLYMPLYIPQMEKAFFESLHEQSLRETSFLVCRRLFSGAISDSDLESIIYASINFPVLQKKLGSNLAVLELFHGPSLAFKDFGARFMSELMSYFLKEQDEKRTILVATSGDTGGAVAAGFHNAPNIDVIILYPKGKVSPLQEKQLTSWEGNITAVEVQGSFDDCQRLVKEAFIDKDLSNKYKFSSANSINIARLIPQSFYYFEALKLSGKEKISISVPSGNFGNITAGVLAFRMGLKIEHFIAANNKNKVFTDYFQTGVFSPTPSKSSISNAMDVGDPSNFPRLLELLGSTWNTVRDKTRAYSFDDIETCTALKECYTSHQYLLDPHSAVGYAAAKNYQKVTDHFTTILSTAHPAKFDHVIYSCANVKPAIPESLLYLLNKDKHAISMTTSFHDFKELLMFDLCST